LRKARALPWTRWGRRPQTPFVWLVDKGGALRVAGHAFVRTEFRSSAFGRATLIGALS
jgi:hypothetical protein